MINVSNVLLFAVVCNVYTWESILYVLCYKEL